MAFGGSGWVQVWLWGFWLGSGWFLGVQVGFRFGFLGFRLGSGSRFQVSGWVQVGFSYSICKNTAFPHQRLETQHQVYRVYTGKLAYHIISYYIILYTVLVHGWVGFRLGSYWVQVGFRFGFWGSGSGAGWVQVGFWFGFWGSGWVQVQVGLRFWGSGWVQVGFRFFGGSGWVQVSLFGFRLGSNWVQVSLCGFRLGSGWVQVWMLGFRLGSGWVQVGFRWLLGFWLGSGWVQVGFWFGFLGFRLGSGLAFRGSGWVQVMQKYSVSTPPDWASSCIEKPLYYIEN